MGITIRCEECKEIDRYASGEIYERLMGVWAVECSRCGYTNLLTQVSASFEESSSKLAFFR